MTRILVLTAAAMAAATPLSAQAPQPPKPITRSDYIKSLDARFNAIDTNHDGKLSRDELLAAQQHELQQAKAQIARQMEAKFKQLDTNHDGQLSLQEFMAAAPPVRPSQTSDEILRQLDTSHDGVVSIDEFRAPELSKFDKIDANHDGVVTPAEIQAAQGRK